MIKIIKFKSNGHYSNYKRILLTSFEIGKVDMSHSYILILTVADMDVEILIATLQLPED